MLCTVFVLSIQLALASAATPVHRDAEGDRDAPLTISVVPATTLPNRDIRAVVRVRPETGNRALRIELDGAFYSSTERSLDGDRAPRTYEFYFQKLPAGEYILHAQVEDASGRVRTAERHITVLGQDEAAHVSRRKR